MDNIIKYLKRKGIIECYHNWKCDQYQALNSPWIDYTCVKCGAKSDSSQYKVKEGE